MAKFPRPDMVGDGEIKNGLISRHHNTSSFLDGHPANCGCIGCLATLRSSKRTQKVVAGAVYGMESIGWDSPLDLEHAGKVDMDKVGW